MRPMHQFDLLARSVRRSTVVTASIVVTVAVMLALFISLKIQAMADLVERRIQCEEAELVKRFAPKDRQTPGTDIYLYDLYADCMRRFPGTMYRARLQSLVNDPPVNLGPSSH